MLGPAETLPKESVSFVFMLTDVGTNERRHDIFFATGFKVSTFLEK